MIGKTITFQVFHILGERLEKKSDEKQTGTVIQEDGDYLIVRVEGKKLPYKVHRDWIIGES